MKPFVAFLVIVFAGAPAVVAQSDTLPPQLVAVSFAPSSVDVTSSVQAVDISMTDDLSGAAFWPDTRFKSRWRSYSARTW